MCKYVSTSHTSDSMENRPLWTSGRNSGVDIFMCCWKCRDLQGTQPAPCAPTRWRSNAVTAMVLTTSVNPAVLRHTGAPHIIGFSDGLVNTLPQYLSMILGLSFTLGIMAHDVDCHMRY